VTATLGPESQPTPGSGILTVRSTPAGANVYVDGEKIGGTTPVQVQNVKPGTHRLLLTLKDYPENSQTIDIAGGSDKEVSVELFKEKTTPGFAVPVSCAALALAALMMLGRRKGR
jgi:hypothetical protein